MIPSPLNAVSKFSQQRQTVVLESNLGATLELPEIYLEGDADEMTEGRLPGVPVGVCVGFPKGRKDGDSDGFSEEGLLVISKWAFEHRGPFPPKEAARLKKRL